MSDGIGEGTGDAGKPRSAGAILREARQAQGLHIAALAALIKVQQRKLEALESDRFDELPDATFTRALAQTVCRALKIDPAPVLALMPAPTVGHRLEQVGGGINTPFRDRPGRREPNDWLAVASPRIWLPALLVLGAALLYFMPAAWLASLQPGLPASAPVATPTADAASAPEAAASGTVTVLMQSPLVEAASAVSPTLPAPASVAAPVAPVAPSAAVATGPLQVRAREQTWVEVQDARSKILLSRMLQPGESVAIDGQAPLKLKIGNASSTEVVFRGQAQDLAPSTRDNVARLELK